MANLLSDPRWQGVAAIVTILAFLLAAYIARDKILPHCSRWQRAGAIVAVPSILLVIIVFENDPHQSIPRPPSDAPGIIQVPIFVVATTDLVSTAFERQLQVNGFKVTDTREEAEMIIELSDNPSPLVPKPIFNNLYPGYGGVVEVTLHAQWVSNNTTYFQAVHKGNGTGDTPQSAAKQAYTKAAKLLFLDFRNHSGGSIY